MENFKELNENELDSIVGGAHVYVDKSHPVVRADGKQAYRVLCCNMELSGDWEKLFSGKGAEKINSSLSISRRTIPADNYARYLKDHQSDKIHEF